MEYADIPTSPTSLPQYGEKSSLSHDEDDSLLGMAENRRARRPKAKRSRFFTLDLRYCLSINLALTSFNLAILLGLAVLWKNGKLVQEPARISPTLSVLPPSPAIEAVEKELRPFTLTSPYNAHPGPETDLLWHNLVNTGAMFPLSREQFLEVNDSPETGIKYTHDAEGRYLGTLASTHQIHCVDSLRKGLWFHHKHYRAMNDSLFIDKDPPEDHLMHCVEMLRNAVMCFGDVSVITYNWKKGHEGPKASFKSMHSCQKWHKIEEWRTAHNVSAEIKTLERPVGIVDGAPDEEEEAASGYGGGEDHEGHDSGSGADDDGETGYTD